MPLTAEELTVRIARCIGIWETNRGGDDPAPKESALDTVCGVHASMATIEQATMPYAVDALRRIKSLRERAAPPLTKAELDAADARCAAVATLIKSVAAAAAAGQTPAAYINAKAAAIAAAGLGAADVEIMFRAAALKTRIDALSTDVAKGKKSLDQAVAAVPPPERLGLGAGSLRSYIRKPANWGENRAGWQRKAVQAMADAIGTRIEAVAVMDHGTALAMPVIRDRVDAQLARTPPPGTEALVKAVATLNNPGEKNYGDNVWATYDRLY